MTSEMAKDLIVIVKAWTAELDAMRDEQKKWPMNHVHYRIYEAMCNQLLANLCEITTLTKKHLGE